MLLGDGLGEGEGDGEGLGEGEGEGVFAPPSPPPPISMPNASAILSKADIPPNCFNIRLQAHTEQIISESMEA